MNPWVILGVLVAIGTAYFAGDHNGTHRTNVEWTAKEQRLIAENTEKAREAENAQNARNAAIEKAYLDAKAQLDDVSGKYRDALAHGLHDTKGTCKRPVPETAAGPGNPPDAATGCDLSPEASKFLWDEAGRADAAALYARAGHDYAVGAH